MFKKLHYLTFLIVFILIFVAACGENDDESSDEGASNNGKEEIVLGVSLMTLDSPFFAAIKEGIEEAAEENDVTIVLTDSQLKISDQISSVENLIAQNVDALLINPVDSSAVAPAVEAANEAGIPVIAIDVEPDEGEIVTLVASNNIEAGKIAGDYIAERLDGKGQIAIMDGPPISSFIERVEGFKEAISSHSEIEIVIENNVVENSTVKFMELADNMLTRYPDLDAIFAVNDFGALAVESAVKSSSKELDVFSVGVDGMSDIIESIINGNTVGGTVAQLPAEMGRLGVKAAVDYLNGNTPDSPMFAPVELITKENADGFSW